MSESKEENKKEEPKVQGKKNIPFVSNLLNIKKNWATVKNNPYAYQKMMAIAYKWIIIIIAIIIVFQFINIFRSYSAGSNTMSLLGRGFLVLVGAVFLLNLWKMYNNMKKTLTHYELDPVSQSDANHANEKHIDVKKEVDEILNRFEPKKPEVKKDKTNPLAVNLPDVNIKANISVPQLRKDSIPIKMPDVNLKNNGDMISKGLFDNKKLNSKKEVK